MKIAVMATGGVGGVFGAMLAKAGSDVHFIARGAHLDAIRANGLKIESPNGDIVITDAQATDDPADIGPVDVVLFAVKLWDTETAADACTPLLGEGTIVLPFQNGVEATPTITPILGADQVGGGSSKVAAYITGPGVIKQTGTFNALDFAEQDSQPSARIEAFHAACVDAGITAKISSDIDRTVWEKFVLLAAMSGLTTASRHPIGQIIDAPEGVEAFRACMTETFNVGCARGVALRDDTVDKLMDFIPTLPKEMKASQLGDLENGKRLEAPWLSGAVTRMGREAGVPTPVNDALYAAIRPFEMGA